MTYDLAESRITGHHAPLYGDPSADSAVRYLEKCGVPERKIAIGSPLYSHGWRDAEYKNAVGVPEKRSQGLHPDVEKREQAGSGGRAIRNAGLACRL